MYSIAAVKNVGMEEFRIFGSSVLHGSPSSDYEYIHPYYFTYGHRTYEGVSYLVGSLGHKLSLELLDKVEEEVVLQAQRLLAHDSLHGHYILTLLFRALDGGNTEGDRGTGRKRNDSLVSQVAHELNRKKKCH